MARPKLQAKTKIVDGVRVDVASGLPMEQSTISQQKALKESPYSSITSESLTPTVDFKLPESKPVSTEMAALGGQIEAQTQQSKDQFTARQESQVKQAEIAKETASEAYIKSLLEPGAIATTAEQYAREGGVDDIQRELDQINNQILQEQQALRRATEAAQTEAGLTKDQANQKVAEIRNKSIRKQADLAVIQMGVQGRYDSAKAIADRYVAAYVETQTARQNALKTIYDDNKELFNKEEQRAFQIAYNDREREIQNEADRIKQITDMALNMQQNGAPTAVVQQVLSLKENPEATISDAIGIGGKFIDAYDKTLKQLQIKNLQTQIESKTSSTGKPLTAAQAKSLGYARRVVQSSAVIDEIGDMFTGAGSMVAGFLPNALKTSTRQQYEQAQRNFINAVLRQESGAAIAETEFDSARLQYFPQPGDSQEVLVQKKQNRDTAAMNLLIEGGQDASVYQASINDPLQIGVTSNSVNPLGI